MNSILSHRAIARRDNGRRSRRPVAGGGATSASGPGARRRSGPRRRKPRPRRRHGCRARPARPRISSRAASAAADSHPADKLPVAQLKLPKNFHLEVFASGVPNARSLRVSDKGTVFVSTRTLGRVYALVDNNGKREVKTLATGLNSPNTASARRTWRLVVLATQIPLIRTLPTPHASRTCVIMPSG